MSKFNTLVDHQYKICFCKWFVYVSDQFLLFLFFLNDAHSTHFHYWLYQCWKYSKSEWVSNKDWSQIPDITHFHYWLYRCWKYADVSGSLTGTDPRSPEINTFSLLVISVLKICWREWVSNRDWSQVPPRINTLSLLAISVLKIL